MALSCALVLVVVAVALIHQTSRAGGSTKVWKINEVPIAFWAWQVAAPTSTDLRSAVQATGARTIFQRAGEFDYEAGSVSRVRPYTGRLPDGFEQVEFHLVYNSTSRFLAQFERLDTAKLASTIADVFAQDLDRARREGVNVVGLQLDLDAPTRLLGRYKRILEQVHQRLPKGMRLSITGLPTWMDTASDAVVLADTLGAVDFWIPQCYGKSLPTRLTQVTPNAALQSVAETVDRARQLGRPFYAGLSAYSYAIHYAADGRLLDLRGGLDAATVAQDDNLEQVERRPLDGKATGSDGIREWRYIYRAREDGVINRISLRAGEYIMLDVMNEESLRAGTAVVRKMGGKLLLGITVYRLPSANDLTNLTATEISRALSDQKPNPDANIKIEAGWKTRSTDDGKRRFLIIRVANSSAGRALLATDAITVDVHLPGGMARVAGGRGFTNVASLCSFTGISANNPVSDGKRAIIPCSDRQADVIRFRASVWGPTSVLETAIELAGTPPSTIATEILIKDDTGGSQWLQRLVSVGKAEVS